MLEKFCLSSGMFGNMENLAAARRRKRSLIGHLIRSLFVNRHLLEKEYPEPGEKQYLLLLCQMKRWTRLVDPKKAVGLEQAQGSSDDSVRQCRPV